tara:strand:- start:2599 stop:2763 length:165 start_codon:yes stop_codon:yes gene_type:complete
MASGGLSWMSILMYAVKECIGLVAAYLTRKGREGLREKRRQKQEEKKNESGSSK